MIDGDCTINDGNNNNNGLSYAYRYVHWKLYNEESSHFLNETVLLKRKNQYRLLYCVPSQGKPASSLTFEVEYDGQRIDTRDVIEQYCILQDGIPVLNYNYCAQMMEHKHGNLADTNITANQRSFVLITLLIAAVAVATVWLTKKYFFKERNARTLSLTARSAQIEFSKLIRNDPNDSHIDSINTQGMDSVMGSSLQKPRE